MKQEEKPKDPKSTIFDRESPRAMRVLRSLLLTFLENNEANSFKKKVDLAK